MSFSKSYLGTVKSSVMGVGKHTTPKGNTTSAPAAFDRPEMNQGVKSFASTMR